MLTKDQLGMLEVFRKNLFKSLTFSEFKKELKESSNSKLQRALASFEEEGLINIQKMGNMKIFSLNLKNTKLFSYLSIFNIEYFEKKNPKFSLGKFNEIKEDVLKESEFFSLVAFNNSSKEKRFSKVGLNVLVVVESGVKKRIEEVVGSEAVVLSREEFLDVLKKKEGLSNDIVQEHFVVYGGVSFYNLILKGGPDENK